jgi:serine/threonine-protein kinase
MSATSVEIGSVLGGKLKVIRRIGAGGMGSVFEVEHTLTKHRRALKLLSDELAIIPSIVTRFLREASAAGHIGNPHVVETFDAGVLDTGEPYIVMELLEGQTLADYIADRGTLPLAETCELLIQACEGMSAAHAAGIIHRDLKPENLFLVKGPKPFVKILDFGISKFDPELTGAFGMTQDGAAMGTPYYMPPEQARGEKTLDAQADVYALGVVLYECLCGQKPFVAETLPHLAILISEGRYEPASLRRPGLAAQCDSVIAHAMVADRSQRYKSAAELKAALEALRGGVPLEIPGTLPFAGTIPVAFPPAPALGPAPTAAPATQQSAGQSTGAPALTDAPLSHTNAEPSAPKRPGTLGAVLAVLAAAGVGAALLLGRASEPPSAATGESASADATASPLPSAPPAPSPHIEPTLLPTAEAPAPSASAVASAGAKAPKPTTQPSASKSERPQGKSRAAEHGLSEVNPF